MQQIKEEIKKGKYELGFLKNEVDFLKIEINEIKNILKKILNFIENLQKKQFSFQTKNHLNFTNLKDFPTHHLLLEGLKPQNLGISNGNQGVPTDKQTDKQTDKNRDFEQKTSKNAFSNALEALESLDKIKKEIRLKFKRLTEQELLVFSILYQINEEKGPTDYKELSLKLNLSESSIRDYVGRLIKKGIPIEKNKINNKQIQIYISSDLRKIASLKTILQLKDL